MTFTFFAQFLVSVDENYPGGISVTTHAANLPEVNEGRRRTVAWLLGRWSLVFFQRTNDFYAEGKKNGMATILRASGIFF